MLLTSANGLLKFSIEQCSLVVHGSAERTMPRTLAVEHCSTNFEKEIEDNEKINFNKLTGNCQRAKGSFFSGKKEELSERLMTPLWGPR